MLKSGDVSFDFGFEWCLGSASEYVAKISMLRLNICLGPGWAKSGWSPDGQECRMGRMGIPMAKSGWSPDGQECRMGRIGYTGWVPDGFQLPSKSRTPTLARKGRGSFLRGWFRELDSTAHLEVRVLAC